MKNGIVAVVAISVLTGCAAASYREFKASNGDVIRIVDTGVDLAGGPRIKVIDTVEADTRQANPNLQVGAQNVGTFQDATDMSITGAVGAWIGGHYYAQGQKNRRPDSTNVIQNGGDVSATSGGVAEGAVTVENSASGGSVGDVGATATGGSAESSSSAGAGASVESSGNIDQRSTSTQIDNRRSSVVNAGIRGDGNVINTGDGNDIDTDINTNIDIDHEGGRKGGRHSIGRY